MLDPVQWLWNKLNTQLANQCCDEEITEEEMESILDEAGLEDLDGLIKICDRYGISLPK